MKRTTRYTFKATAQGQTITVYQNTTQILQLNDATFSSGRVGLGMFVSGDSGAQLSDVELDDFQGGDLAGSPPPTGRLVRGPISIQ